MGQTMTYIGQKRRKTANGFIQTHRLYEARNCEGCPFAGPATKPKTTASFSEAPTWTATVKR